MLAFFFCKVITCCNYNKAHSSLFVLLFILSYSYYSCHNTRISSSNISPGKNYFLATQEGDKTKTSEAFSTKNASEGPSAASHTMWTNLGELVRGRAASFQRRFVILCQLKALLISILLQIWINIGAKCFYCSDKKLLLQILKWVQQQ